MGNVYLLREDFKDKSQLGNKGGNLFIMYGMGLPVPPGFVVPIESYREWRESGMCRILNAGSR